jgi:anti-sigma factor RsiW
MSYEDFPCQEAVELMTEYLEGALDVEDTAVFERHLSWCDWCATYFQQLRQTIEVTGSLREQDIAPPVMDALIETYRHVDRR